MLVRWSGGRALALSQGKRHQPRRMTPQLSKIHLRRTQHKMHASLIDAHPSLSHEPDIRHPSFPTR